MSVPHTRIVHLGLGYRSYAKGMEYLGALVRLGRVASIVEWGAIDARLAAYSGAVRVFGFKLEERDRHHKLAAYRIAGEHGLNLGLTSIVGRYPIIRAPNWYDETLFVFQYAREAQLFKLRNLAYVREQAMQGSGSRD